MHKNSLKNAGFFVKKFVENFLAIKYFWGALFSNFLGSVPPFTPPVAQSSSPLPGAKIRVPPPSDLFSTPLLPPITVPKYASPTCKFQRRKMYQQTYLQKTFFLF